MEAAVRVAAEKEEMEKVEGATEVVAMKAAVKGVVGMVGAATVVAMGAAETAVWRRRWGWGWG